MVADSDDIRDLEGARSGDGEAYRRLVERYQGAIGDQMRRFSRDPAVRDELTQNVFVEAYYSLSNYRGAGPFLHWLRKIAVRVGYRFWTNRKSREHLVALTEEDWRRLRGAAPPPEDATTAADLVHSLFARLSPVDRLVLTLLYLDECSVSEAAERAGWTVVGTRVRAFRARNRLRTLLEGDGP